MSTFRPGSLPAGRTALILVLLILAGCGGTPHDDAPPETGGPAAAEGTIAPHQEVLSLAQRMDEGLPYGASEGVMLREEGTDDRMVRRWQENGQTVKLTATEPDDAGRMTSHSTYYFRDGELFFARTPHAHYIFEGGRLTTWLDDLLNVVEVSEENRASRQAQVHEQVRRYEAAFDG